MFSVEICELSRAKICVRENFKFKILGLYRSFDRRASDETHSCINFFQAKALMTCNTSKRSSHQSRNKFILECKKTVL
jgi:hypothetical protein